MVKVRLHGSLGDELGKEWDLNVSSVAEAFRAIEANTKKLTRILIEEAKNDSKYEILINNRPMWVPNPESLPDTLKDVKKEHFQLMYQSEIVMDMGDKIQTIDVVPVIEGAGGGGGGGGGKGSGGGKSGGGKGGGGKGGFFGIFLSIILAPFTGGSSLLMAFLPAIIGLVALGVSMLLMKPPPMVSPQAIANPSATFEASPDSGGGGEPSYLFNGPVNTVGEGGPIPVGYGRLIIGSHQVFASYDQIYRLQSRSNKYSGGKPPTDGGEYNYPTKSYFFDHFGRPLTLEDIQRNPFSQSSLGV